VRNKKGNDYKKTIIITTITDAHSCLTVELTVSTVHQVFSLTVLKELFIVYSMILLAVYTAFILLN